MRRRTVIFCTILALCAWGGAGWAAGHAPKEPVTVEAKDARKAPVSFDHQAHFKAQPDLQEDCKRCHHQVEDTSVGPDQAKWVCTECHMEKKGEAPDIKDAMHGPKGACRDCHFGSDAVKKLKCNDCHKK